MFSGIVEGLAPVVTLGGRPVEDWSSGPGDGTAAQRLRVRLDGLGDGLTPGASVAINGVCLTLVGQRDGVADFDVVPETLQRTNLRDLRRGDLVNVERPRRIGDRLDGHFVQGHVEGVGVVERIDRPEGEYRLWVRAPAELMPCILPKGSIALDGVSLTVVDVTDPLFSVALIPTTLERTTLGRRGVGERVNIETDILARIVIHYLLRNGLAATGVAPPATEGVRPADGGSP